jgi:hypothetical protein
MTEVEGWFNELSDGGLEIFLKSDGLKVRASGPQDEMGELADWFERKTGLSVSGLPKRVNRGPRPLPGQTSILELSSQDATVPGDG